MTQSLTQIFVHIVFSTKDRRPYRRDPDLRRKMHAYLAGTCNKHACSDRYAWD
jgi:hypothetical protein